jgi:hypothetical protein
MKRALIGTIVMAAVCASSIAAAADLHTQALQSDGWVAWNVPLVAGVGAPCCFVWGHKSLMHEGCDLDAHEWSFGTDDKHPRQDSTLAVYLRVAHGHVDRVRAVAASCPVTSANPIRWIDAVEPAQSVGLLSTLMDDKQGPRPDDDSALSALAYHADASATRALALLAEPSHARESREQALFWLGQARGIDGAEIVERYATTDADPDLRENAIFALSQSRAVDAYAKILAIARSDAADQVRSQSLFWMAQMEDPRAAADITAALSSDRSDDVREQAVFALSQLKEGQAEDALIAIVHGDYPREAKKHALFWLGQSGSPRAIKVLDDLLAKAPRSGKVAGD